VSVASWFPPKAEGRLPCCIALYRTLLQCWQRKQAYAKSSGVENSDEVFGMYLFKGELDQTKKFVIT
jgi:hypothetical protein